MRHFGVHCHEQEGMGDKLSADGHHDQEGGRWNSNVFGCNMPRGVSAPRRNDAAEAGDWLFLGVFARLLSRLRDDSGFQTSSRYIDEFGEADAFGGRMGPEGWSVHPRYARSRSCLAPSRESLRDTG